MKSKPCLHTLILSNIPLFMKLLLFNDLKKHIVSFEYKKKHSHKGGGKKSLDIYNLMLKMPLFCCKIPFSSSCSFFEWRPILALLVSKCWEISRHLKKCRNVKSLIPGNFLYFSPTRPLKQWNLKCGRQRDHLPRI